MSYKNLAGYLLTIAPIVALLIFIVVWEALIGRPDSDLVGEAKIKANLELYSDSMITTKIVAALGGAGMIAMMLGYMFWARLLQGEGTMAGTLATVSAITMPLAAAAMLVSMDFNFASAGAWEKDDMANAYTLSAIGEYAGSTFMWAFISLSICFTALASALQSADKITMYVSGLLSIVALALLVTWFTNIEGGFIVFMLMMLLTVVSGINLIRQKA